ncbi:MAG: beta-1,6-N-acetylglucosaminyltransferase [Clostridia bacterium]|nr:beta-1,6-N-acetylglucosaminyltransferase [Clostridia bacterium]
MKSEKIAIMVLAHKNIKQIQMLISQFDSSYFDIYIHFDARMQINNDDITNITNKYSNVYCTETRYQVGWGNYTMLPPEFELLKTANKNQYMFYIFISGQDLLIKNSLSLYDYLQNNKEKNFIHFFSEELSKYKKRVELYYPYSLTKKSFFSKVLRNVYKICTGGKGKTFRIFKRKNTINDNYYFGEFWYTINNDFCNYVLAKLSNEPEYLNNFKSTLNPDESFMQTTIMNSPFSKSVSDFLSYIDWSNGGSSPKVLTVDDKENIINSDKYFARKFDLDVDSNIIDFVINKTQEQDK